MHWPTCFRHRIPDYMMPKYLDVVDALPTMTSGKIDRKALPPPADLLRQPAAKIAVAETELQRDMVGVSASHNARFRRLY